MSLEFIPTRVFYEPGALDYPLGKTLVERFQHMGMLVSPTAYVRIYVNLEEILGIASNLIRERLPEITQFEGAATSDPVPVERYTRALKQTIEFFGREPNGRFRFVTKYTDRRKFTRC